MRWTHTEGATPRKKRLSNFGSPRQHVQWLQGVMLEQLIAGMTSFVIFARQQLIGDAGDRVFFHTSSSPLKINGVDEF
jgi:hypothetical protein